jgi:RimJ/RimL family protein N-acetyltransferase
MAQHNDRVILDDARALKTLDIHYAMTHGFSASDLHRPGWSIVPSRAEWDPMALLFGQRTLLTVISPLLPPGLDTSVGPPPYRSPLGAARADAAGTRAGVAVVAQEIREPVTALLRALSPDALFTPDGLRALDRLMTYIAPDHVTSPDEVHVHIRYTTPASFHPYIGIWQDWIEPLDETREIEPLALSLLARYSGGVYVIRQGGAIVSFAGIRQHSPHVSEIGVRTDGEALRGHGLAGAVVSRATKAVFAAERLPLYRHHAANEPSTHVAERLGYRLYAESLSYVAAAQ